MAAASRAAGEGGALHAVAYAGMASFPKCAAEPVASSLVSAWKLGDYFRGRNSRDGMRRVGQDVGKRHCDRRIEMGGGRGAVGVGQSV